MHIQIFTLTNREPGFRLWKVNGQSCREGVNDYNDTPQLSTVKSHFNKIRGACQN